MKILIFILGLAAVLELWGIKIGPIIAGLGLFGVAVALGAQDLFKNLISGILVLVEKRFKIGDWISVDGIIEGIEAIDQPFCLGVQWHPEFLIDKNDIKIFQSFVEIATR